MIQSSKSRKNKKVQLELALRQIHFHDLEVFEQLARRLSLSATARELGLLVPRVSKSLKRMETALGLKLFQRSTTGLIITPEGRQFLELCQKLSDAVSSTSWATARVAGPEAQQLLNVAGNSFLAAHLAGNVLTRVTGHADRFRFRITSVHEEQLIALGIKGAVDIAIHARKLAWPRTWTSVIVGHMEFVLCARAGHPLGKIVNDRDVLSFPWITPTQLSSDGYRFGEDRCPLPIRGRLLGDEVQSAELGLKLAANSDQLIFAPEVVARDELAASRIQRIRVRQWAPVRETIFLSAHSERVSQRLFQEIIQACGRTLT